MGLERMGENIQFIFILQVVLARSKANLQSDTLSISLGTSVSLNAVANLNPGEKVSLFFYCNDFMR